ncbi:MAG: M28 family peptidase [Chitinophagaceae bacterium]|nr:M28 family peptidase [Chitinophagaceae bacterium]
MFFRITKSLVIVLALAACSAPKKMAKTDTGTTDSLKAHINYLADDKLEGRRTGTAGELLASQYISSKFLSIGLLPKGSSGYVQPFEVNEGKIIGPGTKFSFDGEHLTAGADFFPFPYSANVKMEAMPSIAVQEADMPWFFDLKDVLEENKSNPHFDLKDYIRTNAKKAKDKGASAVILYNTSAADDKLAFDGKDRTEMLSIPVIYLKKEIAGKYLSDPSSTIKIFLSVDVTEKKRTGANVVGYIHNGAANTVILGAHFDHLGYGEDGNSRNTSKVPAIHNGADDNASGTAALIELARKLKASKAKNNNYLFIAFSGEELGLYGSKYFTEHPTIDLKTANYMINMDMVGRLNDSTKTLTIGGYGTSPGWPVFSPTAYRMPNDNKIMPTLNIKIDSSGTGPSDHTSFLQKRYSGVILFYRAAHRLPHPK